MEAELGKFRLYAMRVLFFLTFIGLAPGAWQEIISPAAAWEPFYGVAVSFWAALSLLAVFGILYPVRMIPLLILQLAYKAVWLAGVGFPLWQQGMLVDSARELAFANGIGVVLDILIIPWAYVANNYFTKVAV